MTGAILTDADFTDAILTEADLSSSSGDSGSLAPTNTPMASGTTTLTRANLTGANLARANLSHSNLLETNFTNANLMGADLSSASFTTAELGGADLRGAVGASLDDAFFTRNTILPDGSILGLNLAADQSLIIRNSTADIPIWISQEMTLDPRASLHVLVDDQAWNSTILFAPDTAVSRAGILVLDLAPGVPLDSLAGTSFQLFDWSGVNPSGEFQIDAKHGYLWDTSGLYTSGVVSFVSVPEPSAFVLLGLGAMGLLTYGWRRRNQAS